jgi:hypothetical protein
MSTSFITRIPHVVKHWIIGHNFLKQTMVIFVPLSGAQYIYFSDASQTAEAVCPSKTPKTMVANFLATLGLLTTVLHLLAARPQEEDVIVTVQQGRLKGLLVESVRGQEMFVFLGIPYAKPPVGELRFKVGFGSFLVLFVTSFQLLNVCTAK